jgi:hypothetical protein
MSDETKSTGDLANMAFNAITNQLENIKSLPASVVIGAIDNLIGLVGLQNQAIVEAYNAEVDEMNDTIDQAEHSYEASQRIISDFRAAKDENLQLKNQMQTQAKDVLKVHSNFKQVQEQAMSYKIDNTELRKELADHKRYKKLYKDYKDRYENLKNNAELARNRGAVLRAERANTQEQLARMKRLVTCVRSALLFEGLAPERDYVINGITYYLYRRPIVVATGQTIADAGYEVDDLTSRMHQYAFRLESSAGGHIDIYPMESGALKMGAPIMLLPTEIETYIRTEYEKETLFLPCAEPEFRSAELQDLFSDISAEAGAAI